MKPICVAVLLMIAGASWLVAQGVSGGLDGAVVDGEGRPLEGVEVFATSQTLQGPAMAHSDGRGRFRLALLPPGSYTVFFGLAGHQSLEHERLRIPAGRMVHLAVTLERTEIDETVISSYSPLLEQGSAERVATVENELMAAVPLARTYPSLSYLSPGVAHGFLAASPAMVGGTAKENLYFVDDLEITRRALGTVGTTVPVDFIHEAAVVTGGAGAEHGAALGGVVSLVTGAGSNELRGEVFGFFAGDGLSAGGGATAAAERRTGFESWDVGLQLGGKLVRDRLWFFGAVDLQTREATVERDVLRLDDTFAQHNVARPDATAAYFIGKLTWRASQSTTVNAVVLGDPEETTRDHRYPPGRPSALYSVDTPWLRTDLESTTTAGGTSWLVGLGSVLGQRLSLEALLGSNRFSAERDPDLALAAYNDWTVDGAFSNGVGVGVAFGGAPLAISSEREISDQVALSLTWAAAERHELTVGGRWTRTHGHLQGGVPGPVDRLCVPVARGFISNDPARWQGCDANGDGVPDDGMLMDARGGNRTWLHSPGALRTPVTRQLFDYLDYEVRYDLAESSSTDVALFVEDAWRVSDSVTVMAGVRATAATLEGDDSGHITDGRRRRIDLGLEDQLQPRLGFTWDFTGEGQAKVYGHFGRYFETYPAQVAAIAWGRRVEDRYFSIYPRDGGGGITLPSLGQGHLPANPGTLVEHLTTSSSSYVADPEVAGQYQDEVVIGAEYEVLADVVVSLSGIHRRLGEVLESVSVDDGRTFYITNPGGCYTSNPVTGEELAEEVCHAEAERSYSGLDLAVKKRYSNGWQFFTSLSWSRARGNYSGLYRPETENVVSHYANLSSAWDYRGEMRAAYGPLPTDRPWQLMSYGSYLWDFGLVTGAVLRWMSGAPISKLGVHPVGGPRERWVSERGAAGRSPSLSSLDLHLSYAIPLGSLELETVLDVFNLFNSQGAVEMEQLYTFSSDSEMDDDVGLLNPGWRAPTRLQRPRSARLGVRLAW